MKNGLMIDLHGTLLYSNLAWALAYESFDNTLSNFYRIEIEKKRSRHELAEIAGIDYEQVLERYFNFLKPRIEVIGFLKRINLPKVIVSNSSRQKIVEDLKKVPELKFQEIYSRENGLKPESKYLESILKREGWEKAYLIGNDFKEDLSYHPKIISIIIPQPKLRIKN